MVHMCIQSSPLQQISFMGSRDSSGFFIGEVELHKFLTLLNELACLHWHDLCSKHVATTKYFSRKRAFLVALIKNVLTERSFSEMKLIKTRIRNQLSDDNLP